MKWLPLLCLASLIGFHCQAEEKAADANPKPKVEENRIQKLLPPSPPLEVNPAIPDNYEAMTPEDNPNGWTYWGPRGVLEAFFKDSKALSQPVFRVKMSNAHQAGMGRANMDKEALDKLLDQLQATDFQDAEYQWGNYPVYTMNIETPDGTLLIGWVGLNALDDSTLMFEMLYPESRDQPSKEDLDVWLNFLSKTQELGS